MSMKKEESLFSFLAFWGNIEWVHVKHVAEVFLHLLSIVSYLSEASSYCFEC